MRISCLHTTQSAIAAYEAGCPEGVRLTHHVRTDFLVRAMGGLTPGLKAEMAAHLTRLKAGNDVVLVTCALLAPATAPPAVSTASLLVEEIEEVAAGKHVEIIFVCKVDQPTPDHLFAELENPSQTSVTCLEGAWEMMAANREEELRRLVTEKVDQSDADIIAVLQGPLMAAASDDPRVLNIPAIALSRLAANPRAGIEA